MAALKERAEFYTIQPICLLSWVARIKEKQGTVLTPKSNLQVIIYYHLCRFIQDVPFQNAYSYHDARLNNGEPNKNVDEPLENASIKRHAISKELTSNL